MYDTSPHIRITPPSMNRKPEFVGGADVCPVAVETPMMKIIAPTIMLKMFVIFLKSISFSF